MGGLAIAALSIVETLRRKEFYVVLMLVIGLAFWIYTINFGAPSAGRFAKDIIMQVTWLASFALAVPLAARQISADLEQKTIYVLMSRPIHRWQYVFGRAGGAAAASIVCFIALFLVLVLMLLAKGVSAIADACLWQAFALQLVALVMLCCTAVCLSIFTTPAGAVTFSLILLATMHYAGPSVVHTIEGMPSIVREVVWAGYLVLPHFEFFNISQRVVHGWGALPTGLFLMVLAYGVAYSIFITALAAGLFRKRWI
jgi:ABC-type transport system involved in multi-copper enzyme maturation permease subunit